MRVLFFMRSTVYVRNFESTLRLLAERGHSVHVVAPRHEHWDPTDVLTCIGRDHPRITHGAPPRRPSTEWSEFGWHMRRGLDYLRYLEPEYRDAPKLRRRAGQKAPAYVGTALGRRLTATRGGRRLLAAALRTADRVVPHDAGIEAFVREHRPDLVLVTPLVEPGSPQSEFLRAARASGVATGLCVYSWDNLTNKGLIHDPLEVVTVWNDAMRREAIELHGVPADRVVVTGAAAYDHWFTWKPRRSRRDFCARVGLNADRPYILYLCSSRFIAPDEAPFVRSWIQRIRARSEALRDVGVLVRPHPQNTSAWRKSSLEGLAHAALWPHAGENPVDADSRGDYYDSMHHSAAVVGVNTSAQIESAIVGRGVFTLLAPEFRDTQEGTLHFRHLRREQGGLLHVAADLDAHVAHLEAAIGNPHVAAERCRRFVETFVRPHGRAEPATPRLVAALEAAAARGARHAERRPAWSGAARPLLRRLARAIGEIERASGRAGASDATADQDSRGEPGAAAAQQARDGAGRLSKPESARIAAQAYEHYLCVRRRVRRMQPAQPAGELTPIERKLVSALEGLWDASPETIASIREYSKIITGVRRSYYRGPRADQARARMERELVRLLEKGVPDLLVTEPPALGGFGFSAFGKTYNEDTLRFFRVISLLQDAALIKDLRQPRPRRTVWEIGGGWGGLAHTVKTLCPDVTYLITGAPELFLVSAVYLRTLFPAAAVRFFDPSEPDAFWHEWERVDFAFAPEGIVAAMRPPSLDLTLDVMALERQTPARIEMHVGRAHELGCRYVLSVCHVAAPHVAPGAAVAPIVERWYWPHPVSTHAGLAKRLALTGAKGSSIAHTYLLGWRRLRP